MKEFVRNNKLLSLLGITSFVVSVSYAVTYNMPDYLGIEGWYSFLNNVSISYIAAFIFYILQVYIPERHKSRRAQKVLEPLFRDLVKFMEITIACCRKYVSLDEKNKLSIEWNDKSQKILYFVVTADDHVDSGKGIATKKTIKEIGQLENSYREKISNIKNRVDFRECNSEILDCFSKLEAEDFYVYGINAALLFENTFVSFSGFQKSVDQFEKVKDKLKKCCGITCKYDIRDADNMEKALCEAIFAKNALKSSSPDQFNEIWMREYIKGQIESFAIDDEQVEQITSAAIEILQKELKK